MQDTGYQAAIRSVALATLPFARITMTGADSLDLLNRLSTQDLGKLHLWQGAPTVLTSDKGRIVDLAWLFRLPEQLLLLTSPGNQTTVLAWLDKYTIIEDSQAADVTEAGDLLGLLGPEANELVQRVTGTSIPPLRHATAATIAGLDALLLSLPLPAKGIAIYVPDRANVEAVRAGLLVAGAVTLGEAGYEALRIEAGLPAFGKELDERFNPLEAELREAISFTKGCYIGQEVIARLDTYDKVTKHLVTLRLPANAGATAGAKLSVGGKEAGFVTSVGEHEALAYVRTTAAKPGSKVTLESGVEAEVALLPRLAATAS